MSILVTISRENTKNFTVKSEGKNTVYCLRTLFSRFKDLPLIYHNFYRLLIFRPPPPPPPSRPSFRPEQLDHYLSTVH
jgi:hypothetical protein